MKPLLAAALLLSLASCSTLQGLANPGPETSAAATAVKADAAKLQADALAAAQEIPGLSALATSIQTGDYVSAAAQLVTLAPALYAQGGTILADAKALVADLRTLLAAASAGKSVQGILDCDRAAGILSGAKGTARVGPAPEPAEADSDWTEHGVEWSIVHPTPHSAGLVRRN